MNIFYDSHRLVLQKLIDHEVDFMLVGGYAVIYYGYSRVTDDLDIWLKPDNDNKKLLLIALQELGFDEKGIETINNWDFTKPQLFHIDKKPDLTDFMTHISGVNYATAKQQAVLADLDGIQVYFIHLKNLIETKTASGRYKDLADVEHLQKISVIKKKDREYE